MELKCANCGLPIFKLSSPDRYGASYQHNATYTTCVYAVTKSRTDPKWYDSKGRPYCASLTKGETITKYLNEFPKVKIVKVLDPNLAPWDRV